MPDSNARRPREYDQTMIDSEVFHEVHGRHPQPMPVDDIVRALTFPLSERQGISSDRIEVVEALTSLFHDGVVHITADNFVMVSKPAHRAIEIWSYVGGRGN